jgi:hypothetical protein
MDEITLHKSHDFFLALIIKKLKCLERKLKKYSLFILLTEVGSAALNF